MKRIQGYEMRYMQAESRETTYKENSFTTHQHVQERELKYVKVNTSHTHSQLVKSSQVRLPYGCLLFIDLT